MSEGSGRMHGSGRPTECSVRLSRPLREAIEAVFPGKPKAAVTVLSTLAEAIFQGRGRAGKAMDHSPTQLPILSDIVPSDWKSNGVSGTLGAFIISGNTK